MSVQTPTILRMPTMTQEEKMLLQYRLNMLHKLLDDHGDDEARKIEMDLFVRSRRNHILYIEKCTGYGQRSVPMQIKPPVQARAANVSKMFKSDAVVVGDSRNALSRCGLCKSTNVENIARQVRSADEGMSVFSTCRNCGHKWVQR
jgi:DNA-directed RNA polymerase subunit M/transcription elongation factor TFIIS